MHSEMATINAAGPFGNTLLHLAVIARDLHEARRLLSLGADPNARNRDGRTPLHYAALLRTHAITELLIEHGGDPDLRDQASRTPKALGVAATAIAGTPSARREMAMELGR